MRNTFSSRSIESVSGHPSGVWCLSLETNVTINRSTPSGVSDQAHRPFPKPYVRPVLSQSWRSGVRPSSVAATSEHLSRTANPNVAELFHVAATEDGRTPRVATTAITDPEYGCPRFFH